MSTPTKTAPTNNVKYVRYLLYSGEHIQNDPKTGKEVRYKQGSKFWGDPAKLDKWPEKFRRLETISAEDDLGPPPDMADVKTLDSNGKEEEVATTTPSTSSTPSKPVFSKEELQALSEKDLISLAEEEEIDLQGATKKAEIIKRILSSM